MSKVPLHGSGFDTWCSYLAQGLARMEEGVRFYRRLRLRAEQSLFKGRSVSHLGRRVEQLVHTKW